MVVMVSLANTNPYPVGGEGGGVIHLGVEIESPHAELLRGSKVGGQWSVPLVDGDESERFHKHWGRGREGKKGKKKALKRTPPTSPSSPTPPQPPSNTPPQLPFYGSLSPHSEREAPH